MVARPVRVMETAVLSYKVQRALVSIRSIFERGREILRLFASTESYKAVTVARSTGQTELPKRQKKIGWDHSEAVHKSKIVA